ncbi:unnamed protein product, partial [Closterium sp. NIES-54]
LEFDVTKDLVAKQGFTAILLLPFILQQELAAVILTVRMLLKRVWSSLLSDGANTQVGFQELLPAYVAKTKYSRLQVSFLKEEDVTNVCQASLEYQRANGPTLKLHWLHVEDAAFTRTKATTLRAVEVVFKGVPANITPEGLEEMLMKHKLKIRQVTPFLEGHCFHRVLHPDFGADTDMIKELNGGGFTTLISRLNASLWTYAREESKRIRATIAHLPSAVATLKQESMRNPKDQMLRELLRKREQQLKEYHACRRERMHTMAGVELALMGEVPSPHLSARIKTRKTRTQIAEVAVSGGVVSEPKQILEAASCYFRNLLGEDKRTTVADWVPSTGKKLMYSEADDLQGDWTEKEVRQALREMASNKTPGKDRLPKEVFELHWDVLGKHVMALVRDFTSSSLPTSVKDAVTILLHKKGAKEQLENYRSITLLNISYKVLVRVLASRIKRILHRVISREQFCFIPGRRMSDAVGLVADVIDAAKNGKEDWLMLLVDLKKSFDSVSRDFIFEVLEKMGFPARHIGWVKGLHMNTRTNLPINF